jgi:hypothetical protein
VEQADANAVAALFADPACPCDSPEPILSVTVKMPFVKAPAPVAPPPPRVISVEALIAFARERGVAGPDIEELADALVQARHGRRASIHEPWQGVRDMARRLLKQPLSTGRDIWILPEPEGPR